MGIITDPPIVTALVCGSLLAHSSNLKAIELLKISPSACSLITELFPIMLEKEEVHLVVILLSEEVYTQSSLLLMQMS